MEEFVKKQVVKDVLDVYGATEDALALIDAIPAERIESIYGLLKEFHRDPTKEIRFRGLTGISPDFAVAALLEAKKAPISLKEEQLEQKEKVESALGITFYPWQVRYIWMNGEISGVIRRTGRTLAFCVKELLFEEEIDFSGIRTFRSEIETTEYRRWYRRFAREVFEKLNKSGIKTASCIWERK